jgi:hypothetical protein
VPTAKQHRDKAENNEFLVSTLDNPFWDWAVVGIFYAAVHYIHAYLSAKAIPLPPEMNHGKRMTLIERIADLKPMFYEYREIYNESRDARYDPLITFGQKDVARLKGNLEKVKAAILPHL